MIAKLRRDFDRVQQRVQVLKGNIDRAKQQHKSSTRSWQQSSSSQSQNDYQGQLLSVQAQLEQDVSGSQSSTEPNSAVISHKYSG